MTIEERAIAVLRTLPPEKQEAALAYIETLQAELQSRREVGVSVLEAGAAVWGTVAGSGDVSTNEKYMEGFEKA